MTELVVLAAFLWILVILVLAALAFSSPLRDYSRTADDLAPVRRRVAMRSDSAAQGDAFVQRAPRLPKRTAGESIVVPQGEVRLP